jgi:ubiquinone/menaquinone biosynthesis C-methylase UbiE
MSHVRWLCIALASGASLGVAAEPPAHDAAHPPPIDCPLHQRGVQADSLRPFAESERYIEFLDRPERDEWQRPETVVAALGLRGTETVADVGAGSGYFAFRFAKALPRGKVVAIDVDPEMVRHVHHKVMAERIENVRAVLTDPQDPGIDTAADVVFVCDVLHHVQAREPWLKRMFAEMRPGARLVVVELKEGKLPEGPPESVKIPKARLTSMIAGAGFRLVAEDARLLPYQVFLVFEKPRAPGDERG